MVKKSRIDYLYENFFKPTYKKAIKRGQLSKVDDNSSVVYKLNLIDDHIDVILFSLLENLGVTSKYIDSEENSAMKLTFNWLVDCDPTPNKENLNWLIGLYKKQLILIGEHISELDEKPDDYIWEGFPLNIRNFYEDLMSNVKSSLETLSFIKKTKVLSLDKRDVNKYVNYETLNQTLAPYNVLNDDDDVNTHTLTHRELKCIQNAENFKRDKGNYESEVGMATLLFEDDYWVIVRTDNEKANVEFGKHASWCTSGTKYTNMFKSYTSRGDLFVLISKGNGSRASIKKNPLNRLQFHFQDQQYMDATNSTIDINSFLFNNTGVKNYFKSYITKVVLPNKFNDNKDSSKTIKFLLNLGYGDSVVEILKESKPKSLDFCGTRLDDDLLNGLGEINSLEKLDLSDCSLTELPHNIGKLNRLKYLKLRNNPISVIPTWIKNLEALEFLDISSCGVGNDLDLTGLTSLTALMLDYNKKLTKLPKGLNTLVNLNRLTVSNCNIKSLDDGILNCSKLYLIDLHSNPKLSKVPKELSGMSDIVVICLDYTDVNDSLMKELNNNKRSNVVTIIKYDD